MLKDHRVPPYLPHLDYPGVLFMGLQPLQYNSWIETDTDLPRYLQHKIEQRQQRGDGAYGAHAQSRPAQQELYNMLKSHLLQEQAQLYREQDGILRCDPLELSWPLEDTEEPLWDCSLWIADDLVLMEQREDGYYLTAASLCSPSHWRLPDKFDKPMREIHDPIPGFHRSLTPKIDRFFEHLRPQHSVVRFNWALQADDRLDKNPEEDIEDISLDTELYYRTERQSLRRLPESGAIAFTIRVYIHPLISLASCAGAMEALLQAVEETPPDLAAYKGFDRFAGALEKYRR